MPLSAFAATVANSTILRPTFGVSEVASGWIEYLTLADASKDSLIAAVATGLGRSAGRLALDQEQLTTHRADDQIQFSSSHYSERPISENVLYLKLKANFRTATMDKTIDHFDPRSEVAKKLNEYPYYTARPIKVNKAPGTWETCEVGVFEKRADGSEAQIGSYQRNYRFLETFLVVSA